MKALRMLLLLLAMTACEERFETVDGTLTVTLPQARADGSHPIRSGGTIPVTIESSLGSLGTELRAKVELVPLLEGDSASSVIVPLQASGSEQIAGSAELKLSRGGRALIRAEAGTFVAWAETNVDFPALAFDIIALEALGGTTRVRVCIETTADSGVLSLALTDASFINGANASDVMIEDGRCPSSPLGTIARVKHADAVLTTTATKFELTATLPGTNASKKLSFDFSAREGLMLVLSASTATLPDAGQVVEIDVEARAAGGELAVSVPVKFETVPATTILPAMAFTDELGRVHTTVLVPENSSTLRIDAVAGQERTGVTLAR